MDKLSSRLVVAGLLGSALSTTAAANTLVVSGTVFKQAGGTTFDTWKMNMSSAGTFTVDVRAYEASQSSTTATGYHAADLNGDGELTWLDPDTYFYQDTGLSLQAADALVRCDDTANNCPVYQNGLTAATSPVVVRSHLQSEAPVDGSIHFRRDPWFDVNAAAGSYLFLVADYLLSSGEAAGGINANDSFSPPSGFVNPITDHADYQVTFSSDTLHFELSGNTISVTAVPVPAAVWLLGSALAGIGVTGRRRRGASNL